MFAVLQVVWELDSTGSLVAEQVVQEVEGLTILWLRFPVLDGGAGRRHCGAGGKDPV